MKRNNIKRYIIFLFAMMMLLSQTLSNVVIAAEDTSYGYTILGEEVPAPNAYELERSVRASDLGLDSLASMSDIFYRNGKIYITMTGKVVITDSDFTHGEIISTYKRGSQDSAVKNPTGIFVTKDNHIYIAEQDAGEIVEFDENHNFVRAIGRPDITGLTFTYAPTKVVVDEVGRIYVKAKSIYEGIIELSPEGEFNRFVGANEVNPSITDRFYRMIATEEQISRMQLWLPTDYSDLALDKDGFLFATVNDSSSSEPVRKLNSKGKDVMPESDFEPRPMGDFKAGSSLSLLSSVACAEDGRFAVLDVNNSRVFVYSEDAHLMYILGGSGRTKGNLNSPIDLAFMNDKILVVDLVTQTIEVYQETEYGALINSALNDQASYNYEAAYEKWNDVLKINPNFYYANLGIAKYQLRQGMYQRAMENFEKGGVRNYYSIAYSYVRDNWMNNNFARIISIIALIVVLVIAKKIYRHFRPKQGPLKGKVWDILRKIKYEAVTWPMKVFSTPFKAFDAVKMDKDGSVVMCVIILIAFAWVSLIKERYTGFLVAFVDKDNINPVMVMASAVLPYLIFIVSSWAVGVLVNGKGNMVDIFKVISYSLYPVVILNLVGTLLSNIVTEDEAALVSGIFVVAYVFFVFYAFIGLIMVHQYTFTKNVGAILLSFVAMLIIVFITLLLVTLLSGFITDIVTIFNEFKMLM
ncbi:MAG: hypothetical protein HFI05_08260 [Lachnospiraceae bacterium]|jgi:tetratricopeptide (TPR) repeat protein|nr:hypothetical protein [Lachnospiraceae bacterium]